jgi:hypothetical protein
VAGHGAAHHHEGERDSPDRRPSSRSLEPPTGELPPQIRSRLSVRARFRFRGLGAGGLSAKLPCDAILPCRGTRVCPEVAPALGSTRLVLRNRVVVNLMFRSGSGQWIVGRSSLDFWSARMGSEI